MTHLHLIGFIEDTKGPFIFRLGGELEVINVLCNNLPVGDEVALEVTGSQWGLDTKLKTRRNSHYKSLRQPKGAPACPRGSTSRTPMSQVSVGRWELGWMSNNLLIHFLGFHLLIIHHPKWVDAILVWGPDKGPVPRDLTSQKASLTWPSII